MQQRPRFAWTFLQILRALLTNPRSLQAAAAIFFGLFLTELLFRLVFPYFSAFLENLGPEVRWEEIDVGFAPILWLVFFTLILGSVTIVISFAAEKVPKLIDIYMTDLRSLSFVWLTIAFFVHSITIKLLSELQIDILPSLILNYHLYLPLFMVIGFPFILLILYSTKTEKVIEHLLKNIHVVIQKLSKKGPRASLNLSKQLQLQLLLFETTNQLIDLLVYVQYKEPKVQIIEGLGNQLKEYLVLKPKFPKSFFNVLPEIREDISFKTLMGQFEEMESNLTFYEQKNFRVIANAYKIFLDKGLFDISALCVEQIRLVGQSSIEVNQETVKDLVQIHLNTLLMIALKHGRSNNEPRNLFNLSFHYGQFVQSLIENRDSARVGKSYEHYVYYGKQIVDALIDAPGLALILDMIATEMQKGLIRMYELNWERDHYEKQLKLFLMLDNLQNRERDFAYNFFRNNPGIRLLQLGLALYFLEHDEKEWVHAIARDTIQDYEILGPELFHKTMNSIFSRLMLEGPSFWEDSDRGNINIYYTPYKEKINQFCEIQDHYIQMLPKPARVI